MGGTGSQKLQLTHEACVCVCVCACTDVITNKPLRGGRLSIGEADLCVSEFLFPDPQEAAFTPSLTPPTVTTADPDSPLFAFQVDF